MPIYKAEGKKDGLQKYKVRINYTDALGNSKQMTRIAYGKDAATMLEIKLLQQLQAGETRSTMLLSALYDEYIRAKALDVRETSLDKSKRILSRYVLPTFGNTKLSNITPKQLQQWKEDIASTDLSLISQKNIFGEFRAMMNYALKLEYIPKNPLLTVGNFREAYFEPKQEKIRYYTAEQFKAYINEAFNASLKTGEFGFFVFFCIAFYTGMRKGEINALKWSDIENNILHVRRSVAQKIKGKPIIETPPKNKSSYRDLQIPTPLLQILRDHKKRQQKDPRWTEDYRVCGGFTCLRDSSLSNKNHQFADAAGLPRIRIHDFRHSHVSLLANEGINIQEIARRLGHSKIEMTWNTYSHLYPREEERAVSILDGITL